MAKKSDIRKIDWLVKKYGLSLNQREILHEEITGQSLSLEEIEEIAKQIKKLYPNK
jgi:hemolysin activation/secretion protein